VRANYDFGDFWRKIGLQNGYSYQVERGDYLFTVVDSAEPPEDHDEWQHEGCYDMWDYLNRVLHWLEGLPPQPEKYNIVLCHDCNFSTESSGMRERYFAAMRRLGVRFGVSGHSHAFQLKERLGGLYPNIEDGSFYKHSGKNRHQLDPFPHFDQVIAFRGAQIELGKSEITITCLDSVHGPTKTFTIVRS
jgi:hypothetical protein